MCSNMPVYRGATSGLAVVSSVERGCKCTTRILVVQMLCESWWLGVAQEAGRVSTYKKPSSRHDCKHSESSSHADENRE